MKTPMLLALLILVWPALAGPSASVGPPPPASPTRDHPELEALIERLPAAEPADSFGRLEAWVQAEDQPDSTPESARRARRVLARFEDIRKAAPPPPEKLAGELAQLLFTVGRALEESGSASEARPVYERIIRDFPAAVWEGGVTRETIAQQAQARLRWHTEKHPWVQKDLAALIARLRQAFVKRDTGELEALIARIGFWSGPFQSEGGADDPMRVLALLQKRWPAPGPAEVAPEVEPFSDKDRQVFLKVSGFTKEFTHIYCILEHEPDGWQWSAVAFAERPGPEPALPEPHASASPASPKPAPGPSARPSVGAP